MNREKIKNKIKNSGHDFHLDVVDFLEDREWEVEISPYYVDYYREASREVDIVATKFFEIRNQWNEFLTELPVHLVIECKEVNNPVVFWFKEKNTEQIINEKLKKHTIYSQNQDHHYLTTKEAAILFSGDSSEKNNKKTYKALTQVLHSLIYFRKSNLLPKPDNNYDVKAGHLLFPAIIVNNFNNLYRRNRDNKNGFTSIDDNFQTEMTYAYKSQMDEYKNEFFLIDIVNFSKINNFLEEIENDVKLKEKRISRDVA